MAEQKTKQTQGNDRKKLVDLIVCTGDWANGSKRSNAVKVTGFLSADKVGQTINYSINDGGIIYPVRKDSIQFPELEKLIDDHEKLKESFEEMAKANSELSLGIE